MNMRVIRFKELKDRVSYSRMHILRLEKAGRFPHHIKLGPRSIGWLESEVDEWIAGRAAGRPVLADAVAEPDPLLISQQVAALKAVWETALPEARRQFLNVTGVDFILENSGGAGVRLRKEAP